MPNFPNCIYKLEATKRTIVINKTSPGSGDKLRVGYMQFLKSIMHTSQSARGVRASISLFSPTNKKCMWTAPHNTINVFIKQNTKKYKVFFVNH